MKLEREIKKILTLSALFLSVGCLFVLPAMAKKQSSYVQCQVELDKDVLYAGNPQKAIVKITLDAPPPPQTVR